MISIDTTIISTLIATIISSIVAFLTVKHSNRAIEKNRVDDYLLKTIDYEIMYPQFTVLTFCSEWDIDAEDELSLRYASYCSIVFNNLEMLWKYFGGNKEKIDNYLNVKEIVILHKKYWRTDTQNISSYPDDFRTFIDNYLK